MRGPYSITSSKYKCSHLWITSYPSNYYGLNNIILLSKTANKTELYTCVLLKFTHSELKSRALPSQASLNYLLCIISLEKGLITLNLSQSLPNRISYFLSAL